MNITPTGGYAFQSNEDHQQVTSSFLRPMRLMPPPMVVENKEITFTVGSSHLVSFSSLLLD